MDSSKNPQKDPNLGDTSTGDRDGSQATKQGEALETGKPAPEPENQPK